MLQTGQPRRSVVRVGRRAHLVAGAAGQALVASYGGDLVARRVGQVNPQGRLARTAELPAGEVVSVVVHRGQYAIQGILHERAVAGTVIRISQRQAKRLLDGGHAVDAIISHRVGASRIRRAQQIVRRVVTEG